MARDGSGTYTRVEGPYVNGVVADADEMNNELDDISDAITDSINSSGTKAMGANWSMGGFRLADLAAPSSANDAARKAYVDSAITAAAQPLDATLTALAALSWASGNPLVQFTAADTISLTLTPSVTTLTTANTSAGAAGVVAKNVTDSSSVQALRVEGDRATPAANDTMYVSYMLSDSAGTQKEFARFSILGAAVTAGAEDARILIGTLASGSLTTRLHLSSSEIRPGSNDNYALGAASIAFSDLFLATGAVMGFGNGNFTLTHVTGGIEASGTVRGRSARSTETGGALTAVSAGKKVVLATAPSIAQNVFVADDYMQLVNNTGSAMTLTQTSGTQRQAGTTTTGNLTIPPYGEVGVDFTSATEWIVSGV